MPKSFLSRPTRIVLILVAASLCLDVSAPAQHGGGGGHGGGGHFGGGGHSLHARANGGHSGGHHWGWLHFGRKRSSPNREVPGNMANGVRPPDVIGSRNRLRTIPSTYIRTIPLHSLLSSPAERFSIYAPLRHRPDYFLRGFRRFPGSGCFFNGFNQVCFFEPAWPLLFFSAGFDWVPIDWGSGNDSADASEGFGSTDMMAAPSPEAEAPAAGQNDSGSSAQPIRGQDLDPRLFLLILRNGDDRMVTDYWLADGYIEYVSRDGTRSHIPVDALDLQETVRNNAARGLSFVLRSAP